MKCPSDGADLLMTERHGIEIDYCPQCRGVWLDKGELDKVIERAGEIAAPHPQRNQNRFPDDNDSDDDNSNQSRGGGLFGGGRNQGRDNQRENPLTELFDFF